jgi:hypothetical protein
MKKIIWTKHSKNKMSFYNLSESRIRRVLKNPYRVEEGIAENTIAVMQPASIKKKNNKKFWRQEIWVMFQLKNNNLKIISAWRYPGKSPQNNPVPKEILDELREEGII